jgi:flavin reductase (DIM6/NTAB) family NADH-FMN oxidoreductase RutF
MALDPENFRRAIGHFASGVTIVTATHGGRDHGMTASAVSSLSLEPTMLLICVNRRAGTHAAIQTSGRFAVHVLASDQQEFARRFATPNGDKFAGLAIDRGAGGLPVIRDALARFECEVAQSVPGGTHTVFLGAVQSACVSAGEPLLCFRGQFGQFADQAADGERQSASTQPALPQDASCVLCW